MYTPFWLKLDHFQLIFDLKKVKIDVPSLSVQHDLVLFAHELAVWRRNKPTDKLHITQPHSIVVLGQTVFLFLPPSFFSNFLCFLKLHSTMLYTWHQHQQTNKVQLTFVSVQLHLSLPFFWSFHAQWPPVYKSHGKTLNGMSDQYLFFFLLPFMSALFEFLL